MLDQVEAAFSHCKTLIGSSVRLMKQVFVSLPGFGDVLLLFSTRNASHAIGIEPKLQILVPVLLFGSEENEHAAAIATFSFHIVVVRDGNN